MVQLVDKLDGKLCRELSWDLGSELVDELLLLGEVLDEVRVYVDRECLA
jgi:hypothetical protein